MNIKYFPYLHFAYCDISEMLESHKRVAVYCWPPFFNSRTVQLPGNFRSFIRTDLSSPIPSFAVPPCHASPRICRCRAGTLRR